MRADGPADQGRELRLRQHETSCVDAWLREGGDIIMEDLSNAPGGGNGCPSLRRVQA